MDEVIKHIESRQDFIRRHSIYGIQTAEEHECEVVVPHCKYGICTDYPHCAGCGAAEWKEVNTDGIVETDQEDL